MNKLDSNMLPKNNYIPTYKFALRADLKEDKQFLPTRAEEHASGWDVRAAMEDRKPLVIKPFEYVKIPLGFRGLCPKGYWYELKPRSSTFAKKSLHALYGTVDLSYEGELLFAAQYIPNFSISTETAMFFSTSLTKIVAPELTIEFGEAIGQIIPIKLQEMNVEEFSNEDCDDAYKKRNAKRGVGGFGSTGK